MAADITAIALSLAATFIVLAALSFMRRLGSDVTISSASIFAALLVFYLVFSGLVEEFDAFGVSARLKSISEQKIATSSLEHAEVLGKDALNKPLTLDITFGKPQRVIAIDGDAWSSLNEQQQEDRTKEIAVSVFQSLLSGGFLGILVTDSEKRPIGFYEASFFLDTLRVPLVRPALSSDLTDHTLTGKEIWARLKQTNLAQTLKSPKNRAEAEANKIWLRKSTSIAEAFETVRNNKLDVLVLVDEDDRYFGAIPRKTIVDRILGELIQ
tara:strand:- start:13 stop:819 length:807 start_codon:yes stop_codon:yes gene_type:complete